MSEDIEGLGIQQIPLILSWAITIHKSQGITLDSAIIGVGNGIFECGQIYVALSRVKSLQGLFLGEFNHHRIMANPKVIDYYSSL
jgi:ATP-dependent DNA helicase PIF1